MKTNIKIVSGKKGWYLKINGIYISQGFGADIKAIKCDYTPYGATEWVSIESLRNFWHKYMPTIIASLQKPYRSTWGKLEFISDFK